MKICWSFFITLLLLSFATVSAQETGNFEVVDCPFELEDGEIEGETIDCLVVTVPESREGLSAEEIELAVIILHATDEEALDPILYLAGGPGNSGTAFVEDYLDDPMRENSSMIFLDQRGTGYSYPSLDCYELDEDDSDDAIEECYERLLDEGITVDAYRSSENAADVNDVIEALELDSVTLYGISYGSRLALTVMKDPHPAIRAVILDGVYPFTAEAYVEDSINIVRVFNTIFAGCAADSACDEQFPDLEDVFYTVVEDLNDEPLEIESADGEEYELSGDDFVTELFSVLYDTESIPYVPALIYAADEEDGETLDRFFYYEEEEFSRRHEHGQDIDLENDGNSEGMFFAIDCADEAPFNAIADIEDAIESLNFDEELAEGFIEDSLDDLSVCEDLWEMTPSDASIREATVSAIPTLLLSGEYDPVTPPRWGAEAAATLSNGYHYIMPAGGHGVVDMDDCPLEIAYQFLLDPYSEPDASCIDDMPPPDWYLDYP